MHSTYAYVLCKSLYVLWLLPWQYYSCTLFLHIIHCMGKYLAAFLLMEIMFFAVLNLVNIIKMNILICTSLCIFISFSRVSTGSWDCWVCGMHALNFGCAIGGLEWLYQFSWQASAFCCFSSTLISISHYLILIKVLLI